MQVNCSHIRGLSVFASESARSLRLLSDIENTLSSITWIADRLNADAKFAQQELECLIANPYSELMDPEGALENSFFKTQGALQKLYNIFIAKREAARQDKNLTVEDGIEDSFTKAIEAVANLYNAIADLRWGIYEHDANIENDSTGDVLSTPEEIRAYLSQL